MSESNATGFGATAGTGTDTGGGDTTAAAAEAEAEMAETGSGIERVGDAPAPGDATHPDDDVPSEFYCPRCEFVVSSDRGSLRAGDICPECRKGYLGERARQ